MIVTQEWTHGLTCMQQTAPDMSAPAMAAEPKESDDAAEN